MSRTVGIDLGTTNSLVACVEDGVPFIIRDETGDGIVPSIVSAGADGIMYVGREAERRLWKNPERSVYSVKRFMGRGIEDVGEEARLLPFRISGDPGGVVRIAAGDRVYTPPEISAFVLRELKNRAEAFFRSRGDADPQVDRAVITVPAYFNDAQRTATRDAGRLAGLDVLRIVNEPTAASLAYGLDRRRQGTIAVYDFGGGTFDISILRVEDGVFQVLSTSGDTHLGGDDIDLAVTRLALAWLDEKDPTPEFVQSVRRAVINAKHELSERDQTELLGRVLARDEFERMIWTIVDRTLEPCLRALADAALRPQEIEEVVLVGGSTRIPLVRRLVGELFGRRPHTEVNPEEVVALGAAVQANILGTGNREMLLLDVTPLSLGIETIGGATSKIILRNSTIPASGGEMFTTAVDNQTAVDIHVVQGERELTGDNRSLARFRLRGIPPMAAGLPRVQVRFHVDENGILSVTATELRTGVEQAIEVKPSYGLSQEEVERMLLDSLDHAEDDAAARQLIEARYEARTVIAATEKSLQAAELSEIIRPDLEDDETVRIEQVLQHARSMLESPEGDEVRKATRALNDATQHLAEVMLNRSVLSALAGKNVDDL